MRSDLRVLEQIGDGLAPPGGAPAGLRHRVMTSVSDGAPTLARRTPRIRLSWRASGWRLGAFAGAAAATVAAALVAFIAIQNPAHAPPGPPGSGTATRLDAPAVL